MTMIDLAGLSRKLIDYSNVKGIKGKDAAVCVLFDNEKRLLLEKRVVNENDPWSGQISFPGGHFENSDVYIINTALRELEEETGIKNVSVLGGIEIQHPRNLPSLNVYPFLCYTEKFEYLRPQKSEIQYLFTPRLDELSTGFSEIEMDGIKSMEKCFFYKNEIIWGMTARIIEKINGLF